MKSFVTKAHISNQLATNICRKHADLMSARCRKKE